MNEKQLDFSDTCLQDDRHPSSSLPSRLVIHTDGGARGNPGVAGYGALIVDGDTGEHLVEVAGYIPHATNNVAEYQGLILGLHTARDIAPQARIEVNADSNLVVRQMRGEWKIKNQVLHKLAQLAGAIFPAQQVSYEWVPRAQNKDADRLANEAMDTHDGVIRVLVDDYRTQQVASQRRI